MIRTGRFPRPIFLTYHNFTLKSFYVQLLSLKYGNEVIFPTITTLKRIKEMKSTVQGIVNSLK